MKIVNCKRVPATNENPASKPTYQTKYDKQYFEINTIDELESFIKNPPIHYSSKTINNFIRFPDSNIDYIKSMIKSTEIISKSDFYGEFVSKLFPVASRLKVNHWLCRGWTLEEAKEKIAELQSKYSKISHKKDNKKRYTTCIEYWIDKGYSKLDAMYQLQERQKTFTLEKCIKKYGEVEGKAKYDARQKRWVESLYKGKTDEQIKQMYIDRVTSATIGNASKTSLKVLLPLIDILKNDSILTDNDYYIGYGNNKEFNLYDKENKTVYFYDFVIPRLNIIIEFNGQIWHPFGDDWKPVIENKKTVEEIIQKENRKLQVANEYGFAVLTIWDTDDPIVNITKCLDFIKSKLNK